jgi:hypothetical protein
VAKSRTKYEIEIKQLQKEKRVRQEGKEERRKR